MFEGAAAEVVLSMHIDLVFMISSFTGLLIVQFSGSKNFNFQKWFCTHSFLVGDIG